MRKKKSTRLHEQEIEMAIAQFSHHFMSDSKWIRLINKLAEHSDKVLKIEFKKIQNDAIGELYVDGNSKYGFDYWHNGFEGNNSLGGWLMFKEIEYLIFPKIADSEKNTGQDILYIEELIQSVGQFCLDIDANSLKLICYKK